MCFWLQFSQVHSFYNATDKYTKILVINITNIKLQTYVSVYGRNEIILCHVDAGRCPNYIIIKVKSVYYSWLLFRCDQKLQLAVRAKLSKGEKFTA